MTVPSPTGWRATSRRSHAFRNLTLIPADEAVVPDLGPCPLGGKWSAATVRYWESLWTLPQSRDWSPNDIEGLRQGLMVLRERAARLPKAGLTPDKEARLHVQLSAEARLHEQRFMLSPLDRQRGRISLAPGAASPPPTATSAARHRDEPDPRAMLK